MSFIWTWPCSQTFLSSSSYREKIRWGRGWSEQPSLDLHDKPFNISENLVFEEMLILPDWTVCWRYFKGYGKTPIFSIFGRENKQQKIILKLKLLGFFSANNWNLLFVRPKIGNREKHQGKQGKHPKKLGKQKVKHEETYGKIGETCRELFSSQFSSRFIHCQIHLRMTAEYAL